jgi:hypothetical protein
MNGVPDLYLAEIDYYDIDSETVKTLRVATEPYQTGPARENKSPRSSELDNAAWTKNRTTASANADTAPDSETTADRLIEDATASASHRAYSTTLITIDDGRNVCISRFLKAGTRTWALLGAIDNAEANGARSYFDLSAGVLGSVNITGTNGASVIARGIEHWPDGWHRCWVLLNMGAGITGIRHYLGLATGDVGANYSGDGVSYLRAWGAQTEYDGLSDYIATTSAAVTRSNPNVTYRAKLNQPGDVQRDMFDIGRTSGPSRTAIGEVSVNNGDGAFDDLVRHGFDARAMRLLWAPSIPRPEYPLGFTTEFVGTQDVPEFSTARTAFKLRDELRALDVPVQDTKYAGDNVPPDGLEGGEDLLGKPKPIVYGKVFNVSPVCVNHSKQIYQVSDGAIASIDDVRDKGISLRIAPTDWSDTSSFVNLTDTRALGFGDGLWVAGGIGGGSTRIETSPDGETWTARTNPFAAGNIVLGLAYSPTLDLWVAVAGAGEIATSPDAITWTARTSGTSEILNAVKWCPDVGLFVAVGGGGSNPAVCLTSTDGITWTSRTSGFGNSPIWGIAEGNGVLVIAGEDAKVATSPDGTTWTQRTSQFDTTDILTATFGAGLFVIGGLDGKIATSVDGSTWALQNSGVLAAAVNQIIYATYGAGWFVLSNNSSTGRAVLISRDGVQWESILTGAGATGYEVQYSETLEVFGLTDGGTFRNTPDVTDYASAADLEDDDLAPAFGTYKTYLAGGYFRLGSSPAGQITADVKEGSNDAARTAGQVFVRVLQRMGYTTGDWSASDITALDSADNAVIGRYINEELNAAELLDEIAGTVGAAWFADASGVIRVVQLTLPTGAAVRSFTAADFLQPLELIRTRDDDRGLPPWRCILRWGRNYTPQTEFAGGVAYEDRLRFQKEWREVEDSDTDIQTVHPLAGQRLDTSLYAEQADAQAEATRRLALFGTWRPYFVGEVELNAANAALEHNLIAQVTVPRFALDAGKKFRVLSLRTKRDSKRIAVAFWGGVAA